MKNGSDHLESALRQVRGAFNSIEEAKNQHSLPPSLRELLLTRTAALYVIECDLLRDIASQQRHEEELRSRVTQEVAA